MNELITSSLKAGDVGFLVGFNQKIINKTERGWLNFVGEYLIKYGQPPTLTRFESEFSETFMRVETLDPLDDVHERTVAAKKNAYVRTYIQANLDALKNGSDPSGMIQALFDDTATDSSRCAASDTFDKSEYYRQINFNKFGIGAIDEATGGLGDGDLAYIVGRPTDGKTTLLLHLVAQWFWAGKNILLVSNEIPWLDMMYKIDCILVGASVGEKRSGNFRPETKEKLKFLKYLQTLMPNKLIVPKRPIRKPSEVYALMKQHNPDIVCIDGVYLMSMGGGATTDWADLASVSRELKQIANTEGKPIVGVIQANRTAEDKVIVSGSSIAGSDALFQDADIILAVRAQANTTQGKAVSLSTTKNRHGKNATTELQYDFVEMTLRELV